MSRERLTYHLTDGEVVTYRAVSVRQLYMRGKLPHVLSPYISGEQTWDAAAGRALAESGSLAAYYDTILAAGVIAPRIWFEDGDAPEGYLHVLDLGDDYDNLAQDILKASGLSAEVEESVRFHRPDEAGVAGGGAGEGADANASEPAPAGDVLR